MVVHTLKCRWCIAESEWYDSVFEKAISATECGFPFVPFLDADEVVSVLEVDFIEEFLPSNSFLQLIHVGEGVSIGNSDFDDYSIGNAQAVTARPGLGLTGVRVDRG